VYEEFENVWRQISKCVLKGGRGAAKDVSGDKMEK
jgi:hypothetical protein